MGNDLNGEHANNLYWGRGEEGKAMLLGILILEGVEIPVEFIHMGWLVS